MIISYTVYEIMIYDIPQIVKYGNMIRFDAKSLWNRVARLCLNECLFLDYCQNWIEYDHGNISVRCHAVNNQKVAVIKLFYDNLVSSKVKKIF